jgi:predicted lysophospholipase L1 biosynthesis ABC-type transport system permease subunit
MQHLGTPRYYAYSILQVGYGARQQQNANIAISKEGKESLGLPAVTSPWAPGVTDGICQILWIGVAPPNNRFTLAVRSSGDPRLLAAALRRVVAAIDPEIPLFGVKTMDERTAVALVSRRVPMFLALGFAAVALFLSAVGVYGVLAYQVAQRQREIGIRMALGGTRQAISGLVLAESGRMFALGLGLGLVGVFAAGRGMRSLLYEVQPADPAVLAVVALVLGAVALTAALIPAQRAQDVDPAVALAAN